jgi:hypothetical protein
MCTQPEVHKTRTTRKLGDSAVSSGNVLVPRGRHVFHGFRANNGVDLGLLQIVKLLGWHAKRTPDTTLNHLALKLRVAAAAVRHKRVARRAQAPFALDVARGLAHGPLALRHPDSELLW